jgi:hypothetical protein
MRDYAGSAKIVKELVQDEREMSDDELLAEFTAKH